MALYGSCAGSPPPHDQITKWSLSVKRQSETLVSVLLGHWTGGGMSAGAPAGDVGGAE